MSGLKLDASDAALLESKEDDKQEASLAKKVKRPNVTWLRRTEYISGEYSKVVRETPELQKKDVAKLIQSREEQIRAIERTFELAEQRPAHPTDKNLTAVEMLPVYPDFELWQNSYTQCAFDADPTPPVRGDNEATRANSEWQVDHSLMKLDVNADDPDDRVRLMLFTPLAEEYDPAKAEQDIEGELEYVRDYNFLLKKDDDVHSQFFFSIREREGVFYNEVKTRVVLQRHRLKKQVEGRPSRVTHLAVNRRELTSAEVEEQEERMRELRGEETI